MSLYSHETLCQRANHTAQAQGGEGWREGPGFAEGTCLQVAPVFSLQGNGHERDFMGDQRVYIMDVYNRHIYPGDRFAKRKLPATLSSLMLGWDFLLSISYVLGLAKWESFPLYR